MRRILSFLLFFSLLGLMPAPLNAWDAQLEEQLLDNPLGTAERLKQELSLLSPTEQPQQWLTTFRRLVLAMDNGGLLEQDLPETYARLVTAEGLAKRLQLLEYQTEFRRIHLSWKRAERAPEEVDRDYESFLAEASLAQWPRLKAQVMFDYAQHLSFTGRYPKALSLFESTLRYLDEARMDSTILPIATKLRIILLLQMEGLDEKANELEDQILLSCSQKNWRQFCLDRYYNKASGLISEDNPKLLPLAMYYLNKAQEITETIPSHENKGTMAYGRLKYYQAKQDYTKAHEAANEALTHFEANQQIDFLVFTHELKAELYQAQNKPKEGLQHALKALNLLGDREDYQGSRETLNALIASLYQAKGQFAEAFSHLEQSYKLTRERAAEKDKTSYEQIAARIGLKVEEEKSQSLQKELLAQKRLLISLTALALLGLVAFALGWSNFQKSRQVFEAQRRIQAMMRQINLGIAILGSDLKVQGSYSNFLHSLFDDIPTFVDLDLLQLLENTTAQAGLFSSVRPILTDLFDRPLEAWAEVESTLPSHFLLPHKNGERHILIGWQPLVNKQQRIHRLLITLRDITEEEQLRIQVELQKEKLVSLGTLTATIVHDIASPSQVIAHAQKQIQEKVRHLTNLLQSLLDPQNNPEGKELWTHIEEDFLSCLTATQSIHIAIQRIIVLQTAIRNHTREDPIRENFCLKDLIQESIMLTHNYVRELRIHIDCPDAVELFAYRSNLGQVFTNLLNNAGDAVFEARSAAKQKPYDIVIRVIVAPSACEIIVEDAGPGISPALQQKIFQPFFTTKPLGKGTGLGLPICKKIIEMHQGTISLVSSPSLGGAAFHIKLRV